MWKKLVKMLCVSVLLTASTAWGGMLYYDDCSSVGSNWSVSNSTVTSDGSTIRQQGSSTAGEAWMDFGFDVDIFTLVFDFKIANPGYTTHAYVEGVAGGTYVVGSDPWVLKMSRTDQAICTIKPDTWYSMAIYYHGPAGYRATWVAEGKDVNLWGVSRATEDGYSPWHDTSYAYFVTKATASQPYCDWELDNITVNDALDLTQVPEPASLLLLCAGGGLALLRRKQ